MKWNIAADSSCDLYAQEIAREDLGFETVPFVLKIDDTDYVDSEELDIPRMLDAMEQSGAPCRTSCPSPDSWIRLFEKAENTFALTISSRLSGSFNSALAAREIVLSRHPDKNIVLLDTHSTGPETALCIRHIADWIRSGHPVETITARAEQLLRDTAVTFALCSFDNLVKNGRMSRLKGFVARRLGMWGIGVASEEGTIAMKGVSRGAAKALSMILEDMRERGFCGGEVEISHCCSEDMAQRLSYIIHDHWKSATISIRRTRGLDSFYAERGGLIVAFCRN